MTLDQSALLDDRYRLDALIGHGGMADVYRGTDQLLDRAVAVKVLREISDPVAKDRFISEARTLAGLNHPALVTLLDAGILGDRPYLVMSLAEESTLADRIASGPLQPEDVKDIGVQLARGLGYAHGVGVVHRDVKPSNVLFCSDDRVLLADFGIARLVDATDGHTRPGDAIGSPAYLAPEQVAGEGLSAAVDVYSLGLVLLEALTGSRAYGGTAMEAAVARLHAPPAIPNSLDGRWRALLTRMTDRDPGQRPTADEVVAELTAGHDTATVPWAIPVGAEATGAIATDPAAAADVAESAVSERTAHPRRRWMLIGTALLAVAFVAALLIAQIGIGEKPAASTSLDVPAGVPARYVDALTDLHAAIEPVADRVPVLGTRLDRIDAAFVDRRFAAARRALTALLADTRTAQRSGDLSTARAATIADPTRELLALLPAVPADTPEPKSTDVATRKPTPTSAPITATFSAAPTPDAPPTGSAPSSTPTPTPTVDPSREATPTASASAAALPPAS